MVLSVPKKQQIIEITKATFKSHIDSYKYSCAVCVQCSMTSRLKEHLLYSFLQMIRCSIVTHYSKTSIKKKEEVKEKKGIARKILSICSISKHNKLEFFSLHFINSLSNQCKSSNIWMHDFMYSFHIHLNLYHWKVEIGIFFLWKFERVSDCN
jgi:hypothetical protein